MAQMTENRYRKLKAELVVVKEKHAAAIEEQEIAKGFGDLSENAEYETARRAAEAYAQKKMDLEQMIAEAEIIEEDRSPRIVIGSVVEICKVDDNDKPIGNPRVFTVEAKGDTVLMGVLGVNSSLGKKILNGTSGIYRIPDNGGLRYSVRKVIG